LSTAPKHNDKTNCITRHVAGEWAWLAGGPWTADLCADWSAVGGKKSADKSPALSSAHVNRRWARTWALA